MLPVRVPQGSAGPVGAHPALPAYRVSLCEVCFRQNLQYFLYSTLPLCFFLFFVVE